MLEHRPIAMPADTRTRVVADEQRLGEFVRREASEPRRFRLQWQQPVGDRFGRGKAPVIEIVAPSVHGGEPLAEPLMKAKGRKRRSVNRRDQRLFLGRRDDIGGLGQSGEAGLVEKIGLGGDEVHSVKEYCLLILCGKPP